MAEGVWSVFCLLVVWIGHASIWTYLLNSLYGRRIPKSLLKPWRLVSFIIIVFGWPIAVAIMHRLDNMVKPDLLAWTYAAVVHGPLKWYARVCLAIGGGFFAITIFRHLRPRPRCLIRESIMTVDFFERHGSAVYGRGKWWWLARLPLTTSFRVDFVERTIAVKNLPAAWDGMTILHLSDFHFHGTPSAFFFDKVLAETETRWPKPDLVTLLGDYVDTDDHFEWIEPLLSPLKATHAKLAILGNHDELHRPDLVRPALERAGFTVVSNCRTRITVRGLDMTVVGHEGPWFIPPPPDGRSDVPMLCLSHTPDNAYWAAKQNCFLTLAGHVHGGAIRVPLVGPIFVPSRFSRRFDGDVYSVAGMPMVVSRGLSGKEPIRFRCHPQVILITLQATDDVS